MLHPSAPPRSCLHALDLLSRLTGDQDVALWPSLMTGVPTGFDADIPASHVFAPKDDSPVSDDVSICRENWAGAEDHPALLSELIPKELDPRSHCSPTSLARPPCSWACQCVEGRKPRLVVDSSVCGTNDACVINEAYSLPLLSSVRHSPAHGECFLHRY